MRRFSFAALLVILAACGGESNVGSPPIIPPIAPPDELPDEPQVDPRLWIDEHFAAGWFPEADVATEESAVPDPVIADAPFEGRASDQGLGARPAPSPPATTGVAGGPTSVEEPEAMPEFEVEELNPRFGGTAEGVAPFTGAPANEQDFDYAEDKRGRDRAEPRTWKRSRLTPNASQLEVGDGESLPLEAFQATARVDGFRARVVLDLTYRNPHEQQLEGTFKLRLPDEASVHFLAFGDTVAEAPLLIDTPPAVALDLGATPLLAARGGGEFLKEARMVPREQAQRAYAAETARQVDPALLEWSGAGVFSTRVFPLLAGRTHRITVAYDVELSVAGEAREFALDLPETAEASRVIVEVGGGARPAVTPNAQIEQRDDATVVRWDNSVDRRLRVRVPASGARAITGDDPAIGPHFAAWLAPEVPESVAATSARAIFLLDASMSSNAERMNVWTALVRSILERNRGELEEFAVLFFNVETWWWRPGFAPNDAETVAGLVRDLGDLALEGATDVGAAIGEGGAPAWHGGPLDADLFLLSDGSETWGSAAARDVAAGVVAPVFCYTTGLPGTDTRALNAVARETGGAVFSVAGASDVAAAATAHRKRPWTLSGVDVAGCSDVVVAGRPFALFPGQRLRIAGRGRPSTGDSAVVVLEQDGRTHAVRVPLATVQPSDLAPRAYGEIATEYLEDLAPLANDEARAYALHYRVTGATCSLLMLESEERYAEYGIVPTADAETVRERPVVAVVSALAAVRERSRGDAKTAFLAWLDRIERASGVEFDGLDVVRAAARDLPVEAFELPGSALACRTRSWSEVSGDFQELLISGEPTYDAAAAEAELRLDLRGAPDALRALSSLVEADPGSSDLLRDVAFSALEWGLARDAYGLLRRVADARPHEPETYRAMAECLDRMGRTDLAVLLFEVALRGQWAERFGAFRLIAAMDYERVLRRLERGGGGTHLGDLTTMARERVAQHYVKGSPDIVVTMTWNTDRTDVDLHVTDPSGEECLYSHPRTALGGAITADVTQGYGPEMFVLGRAAPGEYLVRSHYYSSDRLRTTLRSKVYATVYRHWGADEETVTRHALVLGDTEAMAEILRLTWE